MNDMSERANELLCRVIVRKYRAELRATTDHLSGCAETVATLNEAYDGSYGCDTGCEYVRLEATLTCPHGEQAEYEYGEFGDIAGLIYDMEVEERP